MTPHESDRVRVRRAVIMEGAAARSSDALGSAVNDMFGPSVNDVALGMTATPLNLRLARLVGSGLASQAGMSVEEIEDVRIGIDEACSALLAAGARRDLELRFHLEDGVLAVDIRAELPNPPPLRLPDDVREILDAVTARWWSAQAASTAVVGLLGRRDARVAP